jgi:hypothetical protein
MSRETLSVIERQLDDLTPAEQIQLIERISQRLRTTLRAPPDPGDDSELAAMAADPDIQREIRTIAREFAEAEADGLRDE